MKLLDLPRIGSLHVIEKRKKKLTGCHWLRIIKVYIDDLK